MQSTPFSATGKSFSVHERRGSGPAAFHAYFGDNEAWHVLEGIHVLEVNNNSTYRMSGNKRFGGNRRCGLCANYAYSIERSVRPKKTPCAILAYCVESKNQISKNVLETYAVWADWERERTRGLIRRSHE